MLDIHNRFHIKNNRIDGTLIFLINHFKQKRKVINVIKVISMNYFLDFELAQVSERNIERNMLILTGGI